MPSAADTFSSAVGPRSLSGSALSQVTNPARRLDQPAHDDFRAIELCPEEGVVIGWAAMPRERQLRHLGPFSDWPDAARRQEPAYHLESAAARIVHWRN